MQERGVLVGWLRILLGKLELNKILDAELLRGKVGEEEVAAAVKLQQVELVLVSHQLELR